MRDQVGDERGRDRYGVRALLGLGAGEGEPAALAVGADARVLDARPGARLGASALVAAVCGAVRRAQLKPVQTRPTSVRVTPTVPPGEPLELPPGVEQLRLKVDVRPPQF